MKKSIFILLLFLVSFSFAGTTGKIAGKITDRQTGEPLVGAQVMVTGVWLGDIEVDMAEVMGAVADIDGYYYIINIPPGQYTITVSMIGYKKMVMKKVTVSVNSTTTLNFQMEEEAIKGEEVVVSASKISFKKDQTSTVRNVSAEQIENLPTENIQGIIGMQAGVVNGHFRGGRLTEVSYLVDGLPVDEVFDKTGRTIDIENDAVQDLEVITGTFNAEYGRAMSGIVNAVTKDGSNEFHGKVTAAFGNFYTTHKDVFIGLKDSEFDRNKDFKIVLEGPIYKKYLTFFTNFRYQDYKNHLNGIYRFNPGDYSNFVDEDPALWESIHTGDNSYVPMNGNENYSYFGKISFKPNGSLKLSFSYINNRDEWHWYSHVYKYNPYGMPHAKRDSKMMSLMLNHSLSPSLFYELKLSLIDNENGTYVYENPLDKRYVHDIYHNNAAVVFFTGGQDKNHTKRVLKDKNAKFDITWQVNNNHSLKSGFEYIKHDLKHEWHLIRNKYYNTPEELEFYYDETTGNRIYYNYEPEILPDSTTYSDVYNVKPTEFSTYFQDKMEFDEMVINVGVRFDYFDPNTYYPSQWRNPSNQLNFEDSSKMSKLIKADTKYQISPRFGLSYQLANTAVLHFSYGHFFQMPPFYALYQNHTFRVAPDDYVTTMGNPQLKAEKTVQYEIGLWQELVKNVGLEVNLFYRDIYNLLSTKVVTTFNQIKYGLYTNKDYGNVKGLEFKVNANYMNFNILFNYTLQYTRGNADNPTQTFTRAGNSMDPIARLIPMSWDQRHTLNITVGYTQKNFSATFTGYYNSGTPFTWAPVSESRLANVNLYPNNSWKPSTYSVDFNGYYDIKVFNKYYLRFTLNIYNLLDTKNEVAVNSQTGHAYTAIIRPNDIAGFHSNFTDYYDVIHDPSMFSAPRQIKIGIGLKF